MQIARLYLRASTADQDATRAKAAVEAFAAEHGLTITARYVENESGTKLDRPELRRLLADALPNDIILLEQVDRLSRLKKADWESLRADIKAKALRVVSLDLPTSWTLTNSDEFTSRMFGAVNDMMLDVLAAVARKDYDDRRRRQAEGITKAKAAGRYKGRPEDEGRNAGIIGMLRLGISWSEIQAVTKCSRATVARLAKLARQPVGN